MPGPKPYSRDELLRAMKYTKSLLAASRYLGCSYQHMKPYMKMYRLDENDPNSPTLFEAHKNQNGWGIPKFLPNKRREPNVKRIFTEGTGWESFDPNKIKIRGIAEGYLKDECYICEFNEKRVTDLKTPLLLHFKDGNRVNYLKDNLQLLCYNCYFLHVADPLTIKDIKSIESTNKDTNNVKMDWEVGGPSMLDIVKSLDESVMENMKALGLDL